MAESGRKRYRDLDPDERAAVQRAGLDRTGCPPFDRMLAAQAGVLPEQDATPIKAHVAACPLCQTLCAEFTAGELAAPAAGNLERIRARFDAKLGTSHRPALWRRWQLWVALAGAAASVAMLSIIPPRRSIPEPGRAPGAAVVKKQPSFRLPLEAPPVKLPVDAAITWRGEDGASKQLYLTALGGALSPYRAGDYASAAPKLRDLAGRYPDSAEAAFYLGVSLLFLNQPADALAALEAAARLQPEALRDEVEWFMGVAWERNGNGSEAAARIEKLCARPGPYRQPACSALSQLR